MEKSKFDKVMDYIDENIQNDIETIKKGISDLIGINIKMFGDFFIVLTNNTLARYIHDRQLYLAVEELLNDPRKSILDITLDYGYSSQSSFTRACKNLYGKPPSELRKKRIMPENNKYYYSDFDSKKNDSYSYKLWREFERTGVISAYFLNYLEDIDYGQKEFGFDVDTCYAIADLAGRLEIPADLLMQDCFELMLEVKSDPDYNLPVEAKLGISSEELKEICDNYGCKEYEVDESMVFNYHCGKAYLNKLKES